MSPCSHALVSFVALTVGAINFIFHKNPFCISGDIPQSRCLLHVLEGAREGNSSPDTKFGLYYIVSSPKKVSL